MRRKMLVLAGLVVVVGTGLAVHAGPGLDITREVMEGYLDPNEPGALHNYAYVTDDVLFIDMLTGRPWATNRAELEEAFHYLYNVAFHAHAGDGNLLVGNGVAVYEWTLVGRHIGEFAGIPPSGREVRLPMVAVYELEDQPPYRIERARIYMKTGLLLEPLPVGPIDDDLAALVRGNTAFALALFERIRSQEGNLVFSPFSISTALGMTYAGARGETAREMMQVLRFYLPEQQLHTAFGDLLSQFDATDKAYELTIANALWGQKGYGFLDSFLELVELHYGAALREVDFKDAAEAARLAINDWVSQKTRGLIPELITEEDVDQFTRLVLVNAIYFYGDWALQFNPDLTMDDDFHLSADETVEVPMMQQMATFGYAEFEDLQVLELPYEGDDLSMVVLLPKPEVPLSVLEERLTLENLDTWLRELWGTEVRVYLPKFTMRTRLELQDVLAEMGMPLAFSGRTDPATSQLVDADFSGLTGERDLCVSKVIHEAFIEVDEEGTEAAAATAVIVLAPVRMPRPPIEFRADRPFLFLLRHQPTGSVLFFGRVKDPR